MFSACCGDVQWQESKLARNQWDRHSCLSMPQASLLRSYNLDLGGRLFLNQGNGKFQEVKNSGIDNPSWVGTAHQSLGIATATGAMVGGAGGAHPTWLLSSHNQGSRVSGFSSSRVTP